MAYPLTPNLGLPLVPDGDMAWGQAMRNAMNTLDSHGNNGNNRTTINLVLNGQTGTVALGSVFMLLGETISAPGRFRLYRTAGGRDLDLGRPIGATADPSVGQILEDIFVASGLSILTTPAPGAAGGGVSFCAWSWDGPIGTNIALDTLILEP